MINTRRILQMARRWQKMAALRRRRISNGRTDGVDAASWNGNKSIASKGHFVVYASDEKRFEVPLACISTSIFQELLRLSEDEYGLPSNGGLTLPCDSIVLEYILRLLRRRVPQEVEAALLASLSIPRCNSTGEDSVYQAHSAHHHVVHAF